MVISSQLIIFFSVILLLIPSTHQSIPEDDRTVEDKTSDGVQMDSFYPIVEEAERESLLRDLRSLRARYFNRPHASFPYYKGLGRK